MGLLTIGAFARASRLSPKALRLYDDLGLLAPARVDPVSGYRFYDPAQLARARLVAWLRRLGMPLARIREVCELDDRAAAQEIQAFWAQVETDTAARRDLARFLIHHLSGKDPSMPAFTRPLGIRYAALSDAGLVRESNQDAAYAGDRLLAVADGFGGDGAPASAAAIEALKHLDAGAATPTGPATPTGAAIADFADDSADSGGSGGTGGEALPAGDLLNVLDDAIRQANEAVHQVVASGPSQREAGTTLTAMLWTGSHLALVHIGDSRAYLLRGGELFQITHDHTYVQSMVDEGRLSPDEATTHPQRALLLRALDGGADLTPDFRLHEVEAGDRYLLCSDGLSAVVPTEKVHEVMSSVADPERAVRELVALANRCGGPDNVSCVVAEVTELEPADPSPASPA
jgi:serine/threonine protein phosphatase PrpC/DNA-binding transcriptional MerR regulator